MKKQRKILIVLDGQTHYDLSRLALDQDVSVKRLVEILVMNYVINQKPKR